MVQKEVAEKIDNKLTSKNNKINFFINTLSNYSIEFNVSRNVFYPKPKVESSVVKIIPKKTNIDVDKLENFSKEIFMFKRKKLINVLKNYKIDKKYNYFLEKRAEDLKTEDILKLFNIL